METEYQRSLSHSYMILTETETETGSGEEPDSYGMRVLAVNHMDGLLPVSEEQVDNRKRWQYDVTALLPFEAFCGTRRLQEEDVRKLFRGFLDLLEQMEDYLLEPEHLVLLPEQLYISRETGHLQAAYLPCWRREVRNALTELAEYMLRKTGNGNKDSVVLVCRFLHGLQERDTQLLELRQVLEGGFSGEMESPAMEDMEPGETDEELVLFDGPLREDGLEAASDPFADREDCVEQQGSRHSAGGFAPARETVLLALILLPVTGAIYAGFCLQKLVVLSPKERLGIGISLFAGTAVTIALNAAFRKRRRPGSSGKKESPRGGKPAVPADLYPTDPDLEDDFGESLQEEDVSACFADEFDDGEITDWLDGRSSDFRLQAEYTVPLGGMRQGGGSAPVWELRPEDPGSQLETIPLEGKEILVGKKGGAADRVISDETVSRLHARLVQKEGTWYVSDLNSRNGTSVNGKKAVGREEIPLSDGAQISFARCRYVFQRSGRGRE